MKFLMLLLITLTWKSNTSEGVVHIYRGKADCTQMRLVGIAPPSGPWQDKTAKSGEVYCYRVKAAFDNGVESAPSNVIVVTIP